MEEKGLEVGEWESEVESKYTVYMCDIVKESTNFKEHTCWVIFLKERHSIDLVHFYIPSTRMEYRRDSVNTG